MQYGSRCDVVVFLSVKFSPHTISFTCYRKESNSTKYRLRMAAKKKRFNGLYDDNDDPEISTSARAEETGDQILMDTKQIPVNMTNTKKEAIDIESDLTLAAHIGEKLLEENDLLRRKNELLVEEGKAWKEKVKQLTVRL